MIQFRDNGLIRDRRRTHRLPEVIAIDGLLLSLSIGALLLNVPFGLWRSKTGKFSVQWFAAIHLPVPLIFILRSLTGYSYTVIPLLLLASVAGQIIGGRVLASQKVPKATEEE